MTRIRMLADYKTRKIGDVWKANEATAETLISAGKAELVVETESTETESTNGESTNDVEETDDGDNSPVTSDPINPPSDDSASAATLTQDTASPDSESESRPPSASDESGEVVTPSRFNRRNGIYAQ